MNESKRLPLLCNSPNACTPASITSPAVSAKYTLWILSLCHSVNGQNTLVAAARLRCGILEDDERKRCTLKKKKKKGCQEVNQRVLREALAECVQRQGESRLPSLPILEGSLNTRVPPHPRSHVPRVGKERWRNKLPGARSKWSQQHRKKKKLKGGSEKGKPSLYGALPMPIAQPQPRLGTVLLQVGELLGIDGSPSFLPYELHSILISHT